MNAVKYEAKQIGKVIASGDADEVERVLRKTGGSGVTVYQIDSAGSRKQITFKELAGESMSRSLEKSFGGRRYIPAFGGTTTDARGRSNPTGKNALKVAAVIAGVVVLFAVPLYLSTRTTSPPAAPVQESGVAINDPMLAALAGMR